MENRLPHLRAERRWDVTSVQIPRQCGSCQNFSTTGSFEVSLNSSRIQTVWPLPDFVRAGSCEGAWALRSGKLVSLGEQQFVDCDTTDFSCPVCTTVRLLLDFLHTGFHMKVHGLSCVAEPTKGR